MKTSFIAFILLFIAQVYAACNNIITKDTVQSHYESIVDDVIGEHNEELFGKLSILIKDPNQMQATLKPQAQLLLKSQSNIQDICVAQMPGMIANLVHELGNELYSSIERTVSSLWTPTDQEMTRVIKDAINKGYRENQIIDELGDALEILNMDIADEIMAVFQRFDILSKMKSSLEFCHSAFESNTAIDSKFTEKVWSAVLLSFNQPPTISIYTVKNDHPDGFLNSYLKELTSDVQSELYSRVYDLARKLYEDLALIY